MNLYIVVQNFEDENCYPVAAENEQQAVKIALEENNRVSDEQLTDDDFACHLVVENCDKAGRWEFTDWAMKSFEIRSY